MKKRVIGLLIAICLLVTAAWAAAPAADTNGEHKDAKILTAYMELGEESRTK